MADLRRLDDPSNSSGTLLTLPLSDFPNSANAVVSPTSVAAAAAQAGSDETRDDDGLILISIPPSKNDGGLTIDDLVHGESVYILGDTSENDVANAASLPPAAAEEGDEGAGADGSIEPVAARLIVEGASDAGGKTMELTRVETSNTYIVVPPMSTKDSKSADEGSNKRQKLDGGGKEGKKLVTMPARSVGLVPGEDSPATFFLDPAHLKPGHFGSKLRGSLSRWIYDPFDPPQPEGDEGEEGGGEKLLFGYTVPELAHVCRTSKSEIEHAVKNRVFGAEDALVIPASKDDKTSSVRYGMLSEEGRQTVAMAIVTTLLESDMDLAWKFPSKDGDEKGMELAPLLEEVRSNWHRLEGENTSSKPRVSNPYAKPHLTDSRQQSREESQSQFGTPSQFLDTQTNNMQLADEVIWHCLRRIVYCPASKNKDAMPERVHLIPDEVAGFAAHHVFLRGTPKSSSSSQMGAGSAALWDEEEMLDEWSMRLPSMSEKYEPRLELLRGVAISKTKEVDGDGGGAKEVRQWQYFPEACLPLVPSQRIKSMFAMRDVWTLEEAVPYLAKFVVSGGEEGDGGKGLKSLVGDLLGKHAKAVAEKSDGDGVTKYMAMPN